MFYLITLKEWPKKEQLKSILLSKEHTKKWDIFHINVHEKEGKRPLCKITVENPYKVNPDNVLDAIGILIHEENDNAEPMFIGHIKKHIMAEDEMCHMTLVGGKHLSPDSLLSKDPMAFLFSKQHKSEEFFTKIEGKVPYWNRISGAYSKTDISKGENEYLLDSRHLREGFSIDDKSVAEIGGKKPITKLLLSVEWMQRYMGSVDLSFPIRTMFPGGLINTFTGDNLRLRWWKRGEKVSKSRYWIDHSYLHEINAPKTGMLNIYGPSVVQYNMKNDDPLKKQSRNATARIRRKWFRSQIVLGWKYQQKRREELLVDLLKDAEGKNSSDENIMHIHLRRPDYLSDATGNGFLDPYIGSRGKFFETDFGKEVIKCALKLASYYVALESRKNIISITLPWDEGKGLTVNHQVQINDDRLPRHSAEGKVIELNHIISGEQGSAIAVIKIALSENLNTISDFDVNSIFEESKLDLGIDYPMALGAMDIIENAELVNGPDLQYSYLSNPITQTQMYVRQAVNNVKTEIRLLLRDVSSRPLLMRNYKIKEKK